MKRFLAKTMLIFAVILLSIFSFSCAEKDGADCLFRYSLSQDPKNLDPQLATDTPSLVVIENLFEGLLKTTSKGTITEGVASSFSVSEDGLVYKFILRQNAFWTGKGVFSENVTAEDFVFAFRRLADPTTFSPYSHKIFCIKNSEKINNGEIPVDNLAVKATSKYELEIVLEKPNASFLSLLTSSFAMPCNEKFFYETKGKYGLETNAVIANGAFYLTQWLYDAYGKDNFLILRRNLTYNEVSKVYPSGLNFFIVRDSEKAIKDFKNKETDCIVDDGLSEDLPLSSETKQTYEPTSSGLVFNTENPIFSIEAVRKALSICIDRSLFTDEIPTNLSIAYGLVPSSVTLLNKSFRELSAEPALEQYNVSLAQYLWESSLTKADKNLLNSVSIIVPQSYEFSNYLSSITEQWRENLDFYCVVEILPDDEFENRIKTGNYYIAINEIKGEYNSPSAFLNTFKTGESKNIFGFSNADFDGIVDSAESVASLTDSLNFYIEAEKFLINKFMYFPVFYQKEYLVIGEKISDIRFNPFTNQIDFSLAKNKK